MFSFFQVTHTGVSGDRDCRGVVVPAPLESCLMNCSWCLLYFRSVLNFSSVQCRNCSTKVGPEKKERIKKKESKRVKKKISLCVGENGGAFSFFSFLKQRRKRPMNSSKPHYFGKWVNAPWPVPPTVCQLQEQIGLQGLIDSCVCACVFARNTVRVREITTDRNHYKTLKSDK